MRSLTTLLVLLVLRVLAQPGPPAFCFVLAANSDALRPLARPVRVVQHSRERALYEGYSGSYLQPEELLPLQARALFRDSTERWEVYGPREGMAESFVLITSGAETMRIDLPEEVDSLVARAWRRWDRDTPEVIRFRKGHYAIEALIADVWNVNAANTLAARMIAEDKEDYKKELADQEEYYRTHPPPPPPTNQEPPPRSPTTAEILAEIAARPGLGAVVVDHVIADTVWLRITGRVMLDGGCASGMPLFGIEMLTDTGWVERLPMRDVQMDCGMPWADWKDHAVMVPLAWWVVANSRAGEGEVVPGTYRLVFMGANTKLMPTEAFPIE